MSGGSFAEGLVGVVLDGRYRLDAVLGEGGMGSVFRAQHIATDRKVAIKLLKPHLTSDHTALERFAREARATLKVESPHAVKVLDFGITPHGDYYMALEYLDGRTVQRELEIDGPFSPLRVLHVARQALHALAAAHRRGLVHRDIKPDNILLMRVGDDPDYAKLLDFGVAKLMEGAAASARSRLQLTQAGMVFGTPEFMSPEQACGLPLDGRSDLYSLAATMFAMLTGCGLFEANTAIEWLTHHARTPPPTLAAVEPALAAYPELDAVLQRCLAKHRDQRPRDAAELDQLLAGLEEYVQRGGAGAAPRAKAMFRTASESAYFPSLGVDASAAGASAPTLHPSGDFAGTVPRDPEPDDSDLELPVSSRRGLYLGLGALAVLGVLGALGLALGAALRAGPTPAATATAPGAAGRDAGGVTPEAPDASTEPPLADEAAGSGSARGSSAPPSTSATASPSTSISTSTSTSRSAPAGRARAPSPSTSSARPEPRSRDEAGAATHLENAEAASRAGNRLRQLAEADLALRADPRNVRAKFLLADALIQTGDLERGCAYLRTLGRYPLAAARIESARCPPAAD